jgi:hypothetical protein
MANKDLFKQAIADAKSIREAAIANAKAALEESLTPQLKELLAQRLAEMEEEAEVEEVLAEAEVEETVEETVEEEVVAEEEEAEGEEDAEEEAGDEEEAEDDAEESEDEAEEIEDMTVEDLKDLIRDILSQEMGDMEEPAGEEGDEEAEDMVGMDMTAPEAEAGEEEIDIDELMAELAEMAKTDEEVVAEEVTEEEVVAETEMEEGDHMEEEAMEEGEMNEMTPDLLQVGAGLAALFAAAGGAAAVQAAAEQGKLGPAMKNIMSKITGTANAMGTNKAGSSDSVIREEELAEALETIETLRKDLNEVNLLNAKLLYVNKVFKANNLTESQKANVIAAFDKAETVKEVKLVFETVSEGVVSGGKKEVVKEAKGFASAAVGLSDKPEVITEANAAVLRMQKLAGIIK